MLTVPGDRKHKPTGGNGMATIVGLAILVAVIAVVGIAVWKVEKPGGETAGFPASRKNR